jgi:hypothetical protein
VIMQQLYTGTSMIVIIPFNSRVVSAQTSNLFRMMSSGMLRRVGFVRTAASEEYITSIIRVK